MKRISLSVINIFFVIILFILPIIIELQVLGIKDGPQWRAVLWYLFIIIVTFLYLLRSRGKHVSENSPKKALLYGELVSLVTFVLLFAWQNQLAILIGLFIVPVSIFSQFISNRKTFIILYVIHTLVSTLGIWSFLSIQGI